MKAILTDIQTGAFAEAWMDEYHSGMKTFKARRAAEQSQKIEDVGEQLRDMMSFLKAKKVR